MPFAPQGGQLGGRRGYPLTMVHNSVHLVPVDEGDPAGRVYINNTSDHETYNNIWNSTWQIDGMRHAMESRNKRLKDIREREMRRDAARIAKEAQGHHLQSDRTVRTTSRQRAKRLRKDMTQTRATSKRLCGERR